MASKAGIDGAGQPADYSPDRREVLSGSREPQLAKEAPNGRVLIPWNNLATENEVSAPHERHRGQSAAFLVDLMNDALDLIESPHLH